MGLVFYYNDMSEKVTMERTQQFSGFFFVTDILAPRGRAPFGQHQESRPLARSNDIPVFNGFVNSVD